MPPRPNAQNCVEVKLNGTIGSGKWANVFHLQYTGTAPQVSDLATVAAAIGTAWATDIAPLCPTTVALATIDLADLSAPTASTLRGQASAQPGTRTGTQNPNNVAMVASWQYNLRYRGGHARTYLPAGVQADITNGSQWSSTFKATALANMRAFRTALNAITHGSTTYKLIALSYVTNGAPRPTPLPLTINDVAIHGRADTQRNRLGRETP